MYLVLAFSYYVEMVRFGTTCSSHERLDCRENNKTIKYILSSFISVGLRKLHPR